MNFLLTDFVICVGLLFNKIYSGFRLVMQLNVYFPILAYDGGS